MKTSYRNVDVEITNASTQVTNLADIDEVIVFSDSIENRSSKEIVCNSGRIAIEK